MDLDIEGQSTIVRGLNDSSGVVVTKEKVPKTPYSAFTTTKIKREPTRAVN